MRKNLGQQRVLQYPPMETNCSRVTTSIICMGLVQAGKYSCSGHFWVHAD